jgi:hypothetical protein
MSAPRDPALYRINTRIRLTELSRPLGKRATLNDVPDADLDRLAERRFHRIWFLSVWQARPAARRLSRGNAGWRKEFQESQPDFKEEDIAGSGFAFRAGGTRFWVRGPTS